MAAAASAGAELQRAYWLASRGAQQMDLAIRFFEAARARDLRVLALKGISIADELYRGVENRPMADIDFLVVDARRFEAVVDLARSLGLVETGGSDHAMVFKEPASGVVLELHIALTSCPGLFKVDHEGLWTRRAPVCGGPMFRLGNEDLVIHLALHTAFQHGFVAGEYHARDFLRALETFKPPSGVVLARALEWGAAGALAAMAFSCRQDVAHPRDLDDSLEPFEAHCPRAVRTWLEAQTHVPPRMSLTDLARLRYALAPSKWGYVRRSLLPRALPGRTSPRPGVMRRLVNLAATGLPSPAVPRS